LVTSTSVKVVAPVAWPDTIRPRVHAHDQDTTSISPLWSLSVASARHPIEFQEHVGDCHVVTLSMSAAALGRRTHARWEESKKGAKTRP
jgi:hypothetical protein